MFENILVNQSKTDDLSTCFKNSIHSQNALIFFFESEERIYYVAFAETLVSSN